MSADLPTAPLGFLLAFALCGPAALFARGAAREAALIVGVGGAAAWIARGWLVGPAGPVLAFAVDLGVLVALARLAWKPQRTWPLVLVALQGLVVALDSLRALEPGRPATAFVTAAAVVVAAILMTLAHAAVASRRRLQS